MNTIKKAQKGIKVSNKYSIGDTATVKPAFNRTASAITTKADSLGISTNNASSDLEKRIAAKKLLPKQKNGGKTTKKGCMKCGGKVKK